ncbi:MAG: hypothetical protein OXG72_20955 [Acidobacteria bacterium]|nr:hypothetical protein [Acidobacteriota bacterium]
MKTPIYLDYAATTPTDPAVVSVISRYLGLESGGIRAGDAE